MKVKELIEVLQDFDPEMEVMVNPCDPNWMGYEEVTKVRVGADATKDVVVIA